MSNEETAAHRIGDEQPPPMIEEQQLDNRCSADCDTQTPPEEHCSYPINVHVTPERVSVSYPLLALVAMRQEPDSSARSASSSGHDVLFAAVSARSV